MLAYRLGREDLQDGYVRVTETLADGTMLFRRLCS